MLSVKTRQVAGVTALVGTVVIALGVVQVIALARLSLDDSASRAELLASAIYQAAGKVVPTSPDPAETLRTDPGVRSLLESSVAYARNVAYAAIVDTHDVSIAHSFPDLEGQTLPPRPSLEALRRENPWTQLRAIYSDQLFEVQQPLTIGERRFGSIRIGLSMLLIEEGLGQAWQQAARTGLIALVISTLIALMLAQWMLRPIHVIKSGLTRLGRGEFNVQLDLPAGEEFRLLGTSFNEVSAQLASTRTASSAQSQADLASLVGALEDAVAFFGADGEMLFANPAMRAILPDAEPGRRLDGWLAPDHACRALVDQALRTGRPQGPAATPADGAADDTAAGGQAEHVLMAHAVKNHAGAVTGALLVGRNVAYLGQMQSMLNYSRKLASFSRLMAGVAHEVKNPLNAMTIHLELLKQKLHQAAVRDQELTEQPVAARAGERGSLGPIRDDPSPPPAIAPALARHVAAIAESIRRLDAVTSGLLKFMRPEELRPRPVSLGDAIAEVARAIEPEARRASVVVRTEVRDVPDINADPVMLHQALLNLARNACQAMPSGGVVELRCRPVSGRRVEILVSDTGVGIPPDRLEKIFDLYFTTRKEGSGIGLSLVYRIVQLHDGEISVESTPGRGTTFRLLMPQA